MSPPPSPSPHTASWRLLAIAAVATLAALALLWGTTWPLGIPGEWTWDRIPADPLLPLSAIQATIAAAIYLAVGSFGDRRFAAAGARERCGWIAAASLAAMAWSWSVIDLTPTPWNSGRATWVLYYPGPSGYYTEARSTSDRWKYLADYDDKVAEGDVLHIGTHPPGLVVAYWLLDSIRVAIPAVDPLLAATQPTAAAEWWALIREQTQRSPAPPPPDDGRLLWFAAVVVWLLGLATAWPLGWLVARSVGPTAAWRTALLWPAIPALAIFWPKSDGLLPFFGMTTIALYVAAWDRRSWLRAGLAGLVAFVGIMLTLGLLPSLFWLGVWTAGQVVRAIRKGTVASLLRDGVWLVPLGAAGSFLLLTAAASFAMSLNLPAVWLGNLRNHAAFYDHYPRSYFGWLLVNPVELLFALGLPIGVVAIGQIVAQHRRAGSRLPSCPVQASQRPDDIVPHNADNSGIDRRDDVPGRQAGACPTLFFDLLVPTLVTFAVLWLTGKNSGEAARLWQFQFPWWLALTATAWPDSRASRLWQAVWILQLVACAATCWRVAGFQVAG